jgi:signal transduction histidine kinase
MVDNKINTSIYNKAYWDNSSRLEIYYYKQTINVNIILFSISIIVIVFSVITSYWHTQVYIRFSLLASLSILCIYLNKYYNHLLAKLLTLVSPFICIFVLPIMMNYIHSGMLIWFPYGIMIIGASSFLLFSWEKERIQLTAFLLFFGIASLVFDQLLKSHVNTPYDLSFIYIENFPYYTLSKIILLLFLYSSFYQYKIATYRYDKKVNELNEKLWMINNHLEVKIQDRTKKLETQNKRIKELTYSNSHRIRAYVARITGLINLLDVDQTHEEKLFYYRNINEIIQELEVETQRISKLLSDEDE